MSALFYFPSLPVVKGNSSFLADSSLLRPQSSTEAFKCRQMDMGLDKYTTRNMELMLVFALAVMSEA